MRPALLRDVVVDQPQMSDVAQQLNLRPGEEFLNLYVQDTRASDWRALLRFLSAAAWPAQLSGPGGTQEVPGGAGDIEAVVSRIGTGEIVHMLRVWPADYVVISHFFTLRTIEFGVLARPLRDPAALLELLRFMSDVATAVGKDLKLTYETLAGEEAEALVVATATGLVRLGEG